MGGEKVFLGNGTLYGVGSPPRGRGKVSMYQPGLAMIGITPAWAGKRPPTDSAPPPARGSPPRGRGKADFSPFLRHLLGITPAWAGKSTRFAALAAFSWDHPRVGGEKIPRKRKRQADVGSPPRGRGKDVAQLLHCCIPRITPAWAGKSPRPTSTLWSSRDHPRVGGEKAVAVYLACE